MNNFKNIYRLTLGCRLKKNLHQIPIQNVSNGQHPFVFLSEMLKVKYGYLILFIVYNGTQYTELKIFFVKK